MQQTLQLTYVLPLILALTAIPPAAAGDDLISGTRSRRCGAESLSAVLTHLKISVTLEQLVARLPNEGQDSSLAELASLAENDFRLHVTGLRWHTFPPAGSAPAIVSVAGANQLLHFLAVLEWKTGYATIQDGSIMSSITEEQLRLRGWDGLALHVSMDTELDRLAFAIRTDNWLRTVCSAFIVLSAVVLCCPRWVLLKLTQSLRRT